MLQSLGDKLKGQRWLATLVLGTLALIFAVWGAYGIVNVSFGAPDYALKVNGERISNETVNRAWQQRQAQYQQMLSGMEISDAQKTLMQQQLIDEFVRNSLLKQRATKAGYRATPEQLSEVIHGVPQFQVDGKYDPRAAANALAQIGMSDRQYVQERSEELSVQDLDQAIEQSEFITPSEVARVYALENEQREVRYALLSADRFSNAVKIDEPKIKAWYEVHQNDYMTPESARLKYAQLRLDPIAAQITVKPEELSAYYEKTKGRYSENEKRHAHHILISVADSKDAKADAAALEKAKQVQAELKSGKDFAELAKKYSADAASAAQGGDLGWAEKSVYVGAFGDALFTMQPGQISDPVKTQFGYHIIKLDEIRPAHIRSLDEVRAEIEPEFRRDQAAEVFGDRQEQLQQKLESGSTDLDAIAKQFDLQTGEIASFSRTAGGAPLGGNPTLIAAVFNDDVLTGNKLGGPVAVADDHLVVFRVLEHHAPQVQPLDRVRDEVIAAIKKDASTTAAKAAADDAVKQLGSGVAFDAVVKTLGVSSTSATFVGRSDPQIPEQVRQSAFAVPAPAGNPVYRAVALDNGGAVIVAVSAVKPGAAGTNPQNDVQLLNQHMQRDRQGSMSAYLMELQRKATVKRNPSIFE